MQELCVSFKETFWMEPYSAKTTVLKCKVLFLDIYKSFGTKSKRLLLQKYVLRYYTTDMSHAEIFQTVYPSFYVFVLYINVTHNDTVHLYGSRLDPTSNVDQNMSQTYQPKISETLWLWIFLLKNLGDFNLSRRILKSRTTGYFFIISVSILVSGRSFVCFSFT